MSFLEGLLGVSTSPAVKSLEAEKTAKVAEKEAERAAVVGEYDQRIKAARAAEGAKASSDTPPSGPGTAPIGGRRRKTRKGKSRGGKKGKSRKARK